MGGVDSNPGLRFPAPLAPWQSHMATSHQWNVSHGMEDSIARKGGGLIQAWLLWKSVCSPTLSAALPSSELGFLGLTGWRNPLGFPQDALVSACGTVEASDNSIPHVTREGLTGAAVNTVCMDGQAGPSAT